MSGRSTISLRDRFDRHVVRASTPDGCWHWTAAVNNKGYGVIRTGGRNRLAHRTAYELARGEVGEGLIVRHTCDQPGCVNPAHLELGTMKDNTADMVARGRDAHGATGPKLNPKRVSLIKLLLDCGVRNLRLARLFDVSNGTITQIKSGRAWARVAPLEASC